MPSSEGDKRGNAIDKRRAQNVEASDDIIVHGSHPSFGVIWLSLLFALRQLSLLFEFLNRSLNQFKHHLFHGLLLGCCGHFKPV